MVVTWQAERRGYDRFGVDWMVRYCSREREREKEIKGN